MGALMTIWFEGYVFECGVDCCYSLRIADVFFDVVFDGFFDTLAATFKSGIEPNYGSRRGPTGRPNQAV
jgi:hypothetical protein